MKKCAKKRLVKKIDMTNFRPKNMLIPHIAISSIIANIFQSSLTETLEKRRGNYWDMKKGHIFDIYGIRIAAQFWVQNAF